MMTLAASALPSQRAEFAIPPEIAYLDGAAYSALPHTVRRAGEAGLDTKYQPWTSARTVNDQWAERARSAAAELIHAAPRDMAILSAVSQGIATAARNLDLPPGGRVLRVQDEFPSLCLAFDALAASTGLTVEIVPRPADHDWTASLLAAIARPGAPPLALAVLTPLHWCDGTLIDLDRVIPAVRAAGGLVIVDATQAAGVMPLDVRRWQPDFMAFSTYKWLLGPYGLAFLYVAPRHQGGEPLERHQGNCPGGALVSGAARFDKGERNDPVALPMAATGLELIARWGVPAIEARLRHLTDLLAAGLDEMGLPVAPRSRRAPHILGLRLPEGMPPRLIGRLAQEGVFVSDRLGVLRISPHVWAEEDDIRRFLGALARARHDADPLDTVR